MSDKAKMITSTRVVKVDDELCTKVEALAFETEARRAVIVSCIDTGIQTDNKIFKSYQEDYIKYYVLYQHAKRELEERYVAPLFDNLAGVRWNLQYSTRELTITATTPDGCCGGVNAAEN